MVAVKGENGDQFTIAETLISAQGEKRGFHTFLISSYFKFPMKMERRK